MEGERGEDEERRRRERERQAAEAEIIDALASVGLGPETAHRALERLVPTDESIRDDAPATSDDDDQAWADADRARREFAWFGRQAAPDDSDEASWPIRDPSDRPPSPWSLEREVLDAAAIAALIATGRSRQDAVEQVETTTDRERYERAVAAGVNAEDALAAVEGARLLQRLQADRRLREDQQRQVGTFIASSMARAEAGEAATRGSRFSGDIATDTRGELVPHFDYVNRRVDRLTTGDLVHEPRMGQVRVTLLVDGGYGRDVSMVQVFWDGDDGSHAARLFRPDDRLAVRVAGIEDVQRIEQGLERARYQRMDLDNRSARLIAAHLQRGPSSALYRLAVTGEIADAAMTELAEASRTCRPATRRWARSLKEYCERRSDRGPLPGLAEE